MGASAVCSLPHTVAYQRSLYPTQYSKSILSAIEECSLVSGTLTELVGLSLTESSRDAHHQGHWRVHFCLRNLMNCRMMILVYRSYDVWKCWIGSPSLYWFRPI